MSNVGKFLIVDLDIEKNCGEFRYYGMNGGHEFVNHELVPWESRVAASYSIHYLKTQLELYHHELVVRRICAKKKPNKDKKIVTSPKTINDSWSGFILGKDIDGKFPSFLGDHNSYYTSNLGKVIPFTSEFDAADCKRRGFFLAHQIYKIEVKSTITLSKVNTIDL
ncbi:hypothetical protein UFOVP1290_219 [uncultured Caudovirales phage]|uniref:Uncharacterized protein n=1 Tax=uncultured Caudovirales phage TaxID=2100421 RepID=A0A6J5RI52_9CAUD|nr:hypothetical protein UFOVP1290_219 [uncultured Caudovirales phage]